MYKIDVLPENLRRAREARGYTLDEVSKKLGLESLSSVQKWEKGKNTPNADVLAQLADIYNLDLNYFFTENAAPLEYDKKTEAIISPADKAIEKIKQLEKAAESYSEKDNVVLALRLNTDLADLFDMIKSWPSECIRELQAMAFTYQSLKRNVTPEKKRA